MACRECEGCARRFGTGVSQVVCPFCGDPLRFNAISHPTVTKDEYDAQLYVIGKRQPKELDEAELTRIERDWEAISVEVGKRGSHIWSEADVIGEVRFWSVRSAS